MYLNTIGIYYKKHLVRNTKLYNYKIIKPITTLFILTKKSFCLDFWFYMQKKLKQISIIIKSRLLNLSITYYFISDIIKDYWKDIVNEIVRVVSITYLFF